MEEVVPKMARRRGSDVGQLLHQRLAASTWWCDPPLSEKWAEMARQPDHPVTPNRLESTQCRQVSC